jgi:hypothetical protein
MKKNPKFDHSKVHKSILVETFEARIPHISLLCQIISYIESL